MKAKEFFDLHTRTQYSISRESAIILMIMYSQHKMEEAEKVHVLAANRSIKELLDYISYLNEKQNRNTKQIYRRFPV